VDTISKRYIELYEKVIGEAFEPKDLTEEEIYKSVVTALEKLT
jgi:phosphoribosylaminoimidazole-succinocarboxamide synthase